MTLLDAAHVRQLCILKQTQPQDDLKSRGNQIKPQMRHVRQLCILRPNGETNLNLIVTVSCDRASVIRRSSTQRQLSMQACNVICFTDIPTLCTYSTIISILRFIPVTHYITFQTGPFSSKMTISPFRRIFKSS